jgi:hypothetical protein
MNLFTKQYIIIASALTIISTLIFEILLPQYTSIAAYFVPAFFAIVSVLLIKVLIKPKFEKIAKFSNAFMLTNTTKLFVYLIYFVTSILTIDSSKRIAFAVFFMLMYLIYAVIDTITLLNIFRKNDSEDEAVG